MHQINTRTYTKGFVTGTCSCGAVFKKCKSDEELQKEFFKHVARAK